MENKNSSSEEIDLGQLFQLIGNAFKKLFRFIGDIIKSIFHAFILFLQFLQIHFLKFLIAGIVGVILGWILDSTKEDVYRSSMIVEPNFNSVQQLYNNVEFYDELAEEKESQVLAEVLQLTEEEAQSIKEFTIESFSDQTQKIRQFSEFIRELDTTSQKLITYEDYLKNFNDINAKFHRIQIKATNPRVAKKCQPVIVKSIENNQYFKIQKKVNEQNLALQDTIIEKQLMELDSLQTFYKKLKVIEAQKANGATSINLAEKATESNSEIELLRQARLLKESKIKLNTQRANTENTINVISDFPRKGVLVNNFTSKFKFLLPLLLIILTFLALVIVALSRFLKNFNT